MIQRDQKGSSWVRLMLPLTLVTAINAASSSVSTSPSPIATRPGTSLATSPIITPSASAPSTSSTSARTFTVEIGNGDHKFKPDVIQANVGDTIEFNFYPQNHSVIKAEYEHPCIPYEMTGSGKVGFWSGFHAVDAVLNEPPKWSLLINDTNPTFFYCSAPDSCTKQGMVGVINPNASTSLSHQRTLALQASYQLSAGEPFPSEAESPTSTLLPDGSPISPSKDASPHKLSAAAIAGISLACLAVVVLGAALAWSWGRFSTLRSELRRKDSTVTRTTEPRASWFPGGALAGSPLLAHHASSSSSHSSPWRPASPAPPPMTMRAPDAAYLPSPMSTHAVPPSYFEAQFGTGAAASTATSPTSTSPRGAPDDGFRPESRASRSLSQRSAVAGSSFAHEAPGTGRYARVGAPRTSDMTSPVDPGAGAALGGRAGSELWSLGRVDERVAEGYPDEKGIVVGVHANRGEGPAEMEDTSGRGGGGGE